MKKTKILTPVLTGLSLTSAAIPMATLSSCSCNTSSSVDNSIKTITKKLDNKPDDGYVTVTIEKTAGLDVEFVTTTANDDKSTTRVEVNDNNEFTVSIKFVKAPTKTGSSTFNLNTTCISGGVEKTQQFKNITHTYDISDDFVEIKDGYTPKLSPATGWTKSDFIKKYTEEAINTNGNTFRDDLYTSSAINLKEWVDKGAIEGLTSFQICVNDIGPVAGVVDQFKIHLNFILKADKVHASKFYSSFDVEITDINIAMSLECECFWTAADNGTTKSEYPVLKAVSIDGTGKELMSGGVTGSLKVNNKSYTYDESDVKTYYDTSKPADVLSLGLLIIAFGNKWSLGGIVPLWVSPYCRNVK